MRQEQDKAMMQKQNAWCSLEGKEVIKEGMEERESEDKEHFGANEQWTAVVVLLAQLFPIRSHLMSCECIAAQQ